MYLNSLLLQITTEGAADATGLQTQAPVTPDQSLSLFDLLVKGGPILIPIFLLSFIALYIFIERYLYIRKASQLDASLMSVVRDKLYSGNVKGAMQYTRDANYPIARMIEKGLLRVGQPVRDIEGAMESSGRLEVTKMEKNLNILAAIAAIAPMFGFLGTVIGMIRAFYDISLADNISIGVISSGIYTKMVTSASGLIVGVLAYVFYTTLSTMTERASFKMEVTAVDFLDLLHRPADDFASSEKSSR
jgi:biopolymer transport protein ExbB